MGDLRRTRACCPRPCRRGWLLHRPRRWRSAERSRRVGGRAERRRARPPWPGWPERRRHQLPLGSCPLPARGDPSTQPGAGGGAAGVCHPPLLGCATARGRPTAESARAVGSVGLPGLRWRLVRGLPTTTLAVQPPLGLLHLAKILDAAQARPRWLLAARVLGPCATAIGAQPPPRPQRRSFAAGVDQGRLLRSPRPGPRACSHCPPCTGRL
jgi:hypothetical protein